ncbi:MAG: hypothetical protein U5Q44_09200 [Dehalococcoidia bacterium]|nr:hypothetical protein [Dehalococcoidia bacterium]
MQEDGMFLSGELVELVLQTERDLGIHHLPLDSIAKKLEADFAERGIGANPAPIDARLIRVILDWEDDFLGFAGIPREPELAARIQLTSSRPSPTLRQAISEDGNRRKQTLRQHESRTHKRQVRPCDG